MFCICDVICVHMQDCIGMFCICDVIYVHMQDCMFCMYDVICVYMSCVYMQVYHDN